jgi:Rad3-related DNA helicase
MSFSKTDHWISNNILPRKQQVQALEWFLANQDKKYFFLELPVGTGKSYVGLSIAKILANRPGGGYGSYVLTPQRILQEQYEQTAREHVISLYGKSNYPCDSKNTTCDIGSLIEEPSCKDCGTCPHQQAFATAQATRNNLVLNYALALTLFSYVPQFTKRNVMVFDECHNLERFLIEFGSPSISKRRCDKAKVLLPVGNEPRTIIDWIASHYKPGIQRYINELEDIESEIATRGSNLSQADKIVLRELASYSDHLNEINRLLKLSADWAYFSTQYVLTRDNQSIMFKPLKANKQFQTICEPKAEKFVFMSATILDHQLMCENLGIDPSETAFLSVDSEFPVENRPVFYLPQMKMNFKWNEPENKSGRASLLNTIDDLLSEHKSDSGIIHAGNFQISDWLVANIKSKTHQIFHHNPTPGMKVDRNKVIQSFMECTSPAILISPSITEGLDLKDDLSRFAVIVKVPYKNLQDAWIKRRMEMSSKWYQLLAITDIIQGCGRVVRSADDWGVTYILDESWGYLFNMTSRYIPKWWKAGLH